MSDRPYFAPDPRWWPAIAASLPKPWPREAILADLCWWQDQEAIGAAKRPGRPELARRWGVTDWAVKQALKAEDEWGDPTKAEFRQPTASAPPADRQRAASAPPAAVRSNADNGEDSASRPPADRQPTASAPPADRPARGKEHQPTDTPTHRHTEPRAIARSPRAPGPSESEQRDAALRCVQAIRQTAVNPERCATDVKAVLGLWRALGRPPLEDFVADVEIVAEAARDCPDPLFARDVRAEGWPDGTDRSRSVATLCRRERWGDRLEAARAWEAAGKARASPLAVQPRGRDRPGPPARESRFAMLARLANTPSEEAV